MRAGGWGHVKWGSGIPVRAFLLIVDGHSGRPESESDPKALAPDSGAPVASCWPRQAKGAALQQR